MKRVFKRKSPIAPVVAGRQKEIYYGANMYSIREHALVKEAVKFVLKNTEQAIVIYYFWHDYTFERISRLIGMEEREVYRIYTSALLRIKNYCMRNPAFYHSYKIKVKIAA
jgi:DNA-directed RNA polymerase specialized sigma subunit